MKKYNHNKIERKWRKYWSDKKIYKTKEGAKKPKCYVLDMFPYPSGEGLHVGHVKGYIATDIYSRYKKMAGFSILHPMGWDAFGLPAENFAIKNKIHPKIAVDKNIKKFKNQLLKIGFNYDWSREINTTDPNYYKWTQWIFLQLYKKGLAYESYEPINWCPSCMTGLANEDLDGDKCERCATRVEKKPMRQWVLKITDYAERLLKDLDKLDWPEHIKEAQRNWIGKSEGAFIKFNLKNKISNLKNIEVFTTRIDTIFGCTYIVLAPEHPAISNLKSKILNLKEIEKYVEETKNKFDLQRADLAKDKNGVELKGVKAINPANGEELPIWVADYVLGGYGAGAVMAVPAHDERDWEFAKKYNLLVKEVIAPYLKDNPREDKKTEKRDVVTAIVKNPKNNTYLCLEWKATEWKSFPSGGIDGDNIMEAAKREVCEETGYTNLKFIKQIGNSIYAEFYRPHKDSNVFAHFKYLLFELENEDKNEISQKEKDQHEAVWVAEKEIGLFINVWNQKIAWRIYKEGIFAYCDDGIVINSGSYTGLKSQEAREKMTERLEEKKLGGKKINYKLKDWVFSRQRYWGEPIPLIHCENCGVVAVLEKDLPVELPKVKFYEPTGTGESPLAKIEKWVNVKCPECGGKARRETNTMPQWAGSSWYYLRYIDPKNKKALISEKKEKYWMPVDVYVGGAEHATRHLIYARFWHKFLFDIKAANCEEPFKRFYNVGLVNAEDGRKMSKRWKNVISPDDIVKDFGVDALRLYEMFIGPFDQAALWNSKNIMGVKRFLEKVWKLNSKLQITNYKQILNSKSQNSKLESLIHKTIKKVSEDIEEFKFNTAISALMILINETEKADLIKVEDFKLIIKLLSPFAPHMTEELWADLGGKKSIYLEKWPQYNQEKIEEKTFKLVAQINGKIRAVFDAPFNISEKEAKILTLKEENVKKWIIGKPVKKIIFVPNKLINIVTQ